MNIIKTSFINTAKITGIVFLIGLIILTLMQGEMLTERIKILSYLVFGYGVPIVFANSYFLKSLSQTTPWNEQKTQRFWKGLLGSVAISMLMVFVVNFIQWVVIWGADFSALFSERNMIFYLITLLLAVVVSSIIHIKASRQYKF